MGYVPVAADDLAAYLDGALPLRALVSQAPSLLVVDCGAQGAIVAGWALCGHDVPAAYLTVADSMLSPLIATPEDHGRVTAAHARLAEAHVALEVAQARLAAARTRIDAATLPATSWGC